MREKEEMAFLSEEGRTDGQPCPSSFKGMRRIITFAVNTSQVFNTCEV